MSLEKTLDDATRTEIEAAAFRRLLEHLGKHPEVQNIELMNLAFFCRNCIAKWYSAEAMQRGVSMDYEQAREVVYGMPYGEYKARYLEKATSEQLAVFDHARLKASD
ncbi:MAG: DUF1244 domain-containing protein [Gammaproteobacteria bacterium]|jgi:hypothetical protein|nr:DUF1244 domain-containing protein [Gammaproteobacteria bacterium]